MTAITTDSPFDLDNDDAYHAWREQKIADHPAKLEELVVEVSNPQRLTETEHEAILDRCKRTNMAIYAGPTGDDPDTHIIRDLGRQFGLERLDHNPGADEDAVSALSVQEDTYHRRYIPYTNRPIAWHTDGYYNTPERQVHGLVLHCVQPADEGGENDLLDHEMLYISLRDRNPEYIRALMHPRAMVIPANVVDGKETRPERAGPVFSVRPDGRLHMRYTDRSRSIAWRDERLSNEAVAYLQELLHTPGPWRFRGKLQAGQGLICNNVLHTRTGFTDGEHKRLLYRARYYDRISGT